MSGTLLITLIILALLVMLVIAHVIIFYEMYVYYLGFGMTRKQAFLATWRLYGE